MPRISRESDARNGLFRSEMTLQCNAIPSDSHASCSTTPTRPRSFSFPAGFIEFFDYFYVHRTIWTDGRELPKDPDPTWYGVSVGKWEGDTLVVETVGFNDRTWIDDDGHPHSEDMRVEERYRRIDHDNMELNMTITIQSRTRNRGWARRKPGNSTRSWNCERTFASLQMKRSTKRR